MDATKDSKADGQDVALEVARKIASLRHTDVLVRKPGDKDIKCDFILDAVGIGRFYFVYDPSQQGPSGILATVKVHKRSK